MSLSVLVVDDIPLNIKLLEARLSSQNFDVITANSGAEALDVCQHKKVDLLLLDLEMPKMSGFEVCKRLKSDARTKYIPIIVITAHVEDCEKAKAYEMGANEFLSKPFDDVALTARIDNLLKQKKLQEEISKREVFSRPTGQSGKDWRSLKGILHSQEGGRVLFLDESTRLISKVLSVLSDRHNITVETSLKSARQTLQDYPFDLFILNACGSPEEVLKFISEIRSNNAMAQPSILLIVLPGDDFLHAALKGGVNDFLSSPINQYDLLARVNVQVTTQRLSQYLATFDKA